MGHRDTGQTQGSGLPASLPSHPKSYITSPAFVGQHLYILLQAHDLSGSGLLLPS